MDAPGVPRNETESDAQFNDLEDPADSPHMPYITGISFRWLSPSLLCAEPTEVAEVLRRRACELRLGFLSARVPASVNPPMARVHIACGLPLDIMLFATGSISAPRQSPPTGAYETGTCQ